MSIRKNNLYEHIRTGYIYKVVGIGRSVIEPNKLVVIYKSTKETRFKDSGEQCGWIALPVGTLWTREFTDFTDKFRKVRNNYRE